MTQPPIPRRHWGLICLWAQGHSVAFLTPTNTWTPCLNPMWNPWATYSIELVTYRLISAPDGVTIQPLDPATTPEA